MILVKVELQKLILSQYNRGSGDISILYNDGKDRMVSKRVKMENSELLADEFMRMIRQQVKDQNRPPYQEDDVLLDTVIPRFTKDEEEVTTKIKVFLAKINAKAKGMDQQKTGMSYLNSWTQMKSMEFEF